MRLVHLCVILFAPVLIFAQTDPASNIAVAVGDSLLFDYTVLEPVAGNSDVWVSKDTVRFRIYYVDAECTTYDYQFARDGKSLIVKRVTMNAELCDNGSELLYGVEGRIWPVPKGKYLFELEAVVGTKMSITLRDVAVVK
jgi:hypothetical protein